MKRGEGSKTERQHSTCWSRCREGHHRCVGTLQRASKLLDPTITRIGLCLEVVPTKKKEVRNSRGHASPRYIMQVSPPVTQNLTTSLLLASIYRINAILNLGPPGTRSTHSYARLPEGGTTGKTRSSRRAKSREDDVASETAASNLTPSSPARRLHRPEVRCSDELILVER
ncbi:uncharacterized protein LOC135397288 [Ornithodoros turicata]|uniref:uncharacterized protein LOC135397288 n=1 Tax=Ornithodoros turicata TaxID=34597 RepID=UPI0031398158